MRCELGECIERVRERRQEPVGIEQSLAIGRAERDHQLRNGVVERMGGQRRKIIARSRWRDHQRLQPRVFELLRAPDLRQHRALPRRKLFGKGRDRMNVEQRAVSVEHECAGRTDHLHRHKKRGVTLARNPLVHVVGDTGFEPVTPAV